MKQREKVAVKINPEAKVIKIVTEMIKDNDWVIKLESSTGDEIRKTFNRISEEITSVIETRKNENEIARKRKEPRKSWDDINKIVNRKHQEWLEFKNRYDKEGNLKSLN